MVCIMTTVMRKNTFIIIIMTMMGLGGRVAGESPNFERGMLATEAGG